MTRAQKSIGHYLRDYRKHRGHTLDSLAKKTGLAKGLLSRIENGKGNPCLLTLKKLAIALECRFIIGP